MAIFVAVPAQNFVGFNCSLFICFVQGALRASLATFGRAAKIKSAFPGLWSINRPLDDSHASSNKSHEHQDLTIFYFLVSFHDCAEGSPEQEYLVELMALYRSKAVLHCTRI